MTKVIFKNRKLNIKNLLSFGFEKTDNGYIYHTNIVDGQMELIVKADIDGTIYTEVIDNSSSEEYILHLVSSASGSFVGKVKSEFICFSILSLDGDYCAYIYGEMDN